MSADCAINPGGSWESSMTIDLFEPEQRKGAVSLFSPHAITDDLDAALDLVR
jgi:hypothetical protein